MPTLAQVLELQQVLVEQFDSMSVNIEVRKALAPPFDLFLGYGVRVTETRAHHFHILILADNRYSVATRTVELQEGKWRATVKWRGLGSSTDLASLINLLENYHDGLRY